MSTHRRGHVVSTVPGMQILKIGLELYKRSLNSENNRSRFVQRWNTFVGKTRVKQMQGILPISSFV